jgi:hypothetical protein
MTVYAMRNEEYQPYGVAVYRNIQEIRCELKCHCAPDQDLESIVDDFVSKCEVVEISEYPENGYFQTSEMFEESLIIE